VKPSSANQFSRCARDDKSPVKASRTQQRQRALALRPHDRHIAPVIPRRLFLFVTILLLFIDDDQPEILQGRKHRRPRPHYNPCSPFRTRPTTPRPLHIAQRECKPPRLRTSPQTTTGIAFPIHKVSAISGTKMIAVFPARQRFPARTANTLPFSAPVTRATTARQIRPIQSARECSSSRFPCSSFNACAAGTYPVSNGSSAGSTASSQLSNNPRQACVRSNSVKPARASTVAPTVVGPRSVRAVDRTLSSFSFSVFSALSANPFHVTIVCDFLSYPADSLESRSNPTRCSLCTPRSKCPSSPPC